MNAPQRATRIESRTLWLFVACALLPVAAFAALGYMVVSSELRNLAKDRLDAAARNYGLILLDRLQQVDAGVVRQAQQLLHSQADEMQPLETEEAVFRLVSLSRQPIATSAQTDLSRTLRAVKRDGETRVIIEVSVRDPAGSVVMQAELAPRYLFNADAVLLPDATACVRMNDTLPMGCAVSGDQAHQLEPADNDVAGLHSEWTLFLNASYGVPSWRVEISQPRATALHALDAFRWVLPVSATLAVAAALLFGSIFIRRSHAPLRLLSQAARRIARRDFSQPIRVESRDEYGRLVRTFNRMADTLHHQFALQSTLSRVDEIILSRGSALAAIDSMLMQLPGILSCRGAGIVLITGTGTARVRLAAIDREEPHDYEVTPGALPRQLPHSGVHVVSRTACPAIFGNLPREFQTLLLSAIFVSGQVRGYAIASDERSGRASSHRLPGIAQRIAVAIGNDDHQRQLWRQANFDPLTGLASRTLLCERLVEAITESVAQQRQGALVFLDLDRFKSVNDSLGHSVGDSLLRQVAARLTSQAPAGSTVARFGGDEFVVVIPHMGRDPARDFADRLLEALADPCSLNELRYVTHASIGIALFPEHGDSVEGLLKNADIAMYRAKSSGRGKACIFDERMSADASSRLQLEERLRLAISMGKIRPHFQPKVSASGETVAVEALARWYEGDKAIPPTSFIPLAEETGLVVALGQSMLRESCRQMRLWINEGISLQHVAVNISMLQMRDPGFPDFVERCLAEWGLSGDKLELELTESLIAEDTVAVAQQLARLTQLGVRIAIDDFGTGFSSMSRLRDYPINTLKIDQSFVRDCHRSQGARLLVKALIDVGHALNLEVVAEGVETMLELEILRDLGCNMVQGYLFARPMAPTDVASFMLGRDATTDPVRQAV